MGTSNIKGIPAMSPPEVHDYLRDIGRSWSGQGCAMEVGCWLGASSVPMLEGLVEADYDKPFWAFDRWQANRDEVRKARLQSVNLKVGQDIRPIYIEYTQQVYQNIKAIKGLIPSTLRKFTPEPIEFCVFDAPKRNPVFIDSVHALEPYFIPGVTVFGLMDYHFYLRRMDQPGKRDWKRFLAPVEFIKKYQSNFTMMRDFKEDSSCVFFKYEKPITWK